MTTKLISIGGGTCSGKSTLSRMVGENVERENANWHSIPVDMDTFFKKEKDVPMNETGVRDWDNPQALDVEEFLKFLQSAQQKPNDFCSTCSTKKNQTNESDISHLIIVEGFLLYVALPKDVLENKFDSKFFVDIDYDLMKKRRSTRFYPTEDGPQLDPPGYFDSHVWPSYVRYNDVKKLKSEGILILNANSDLMESTKLVLKTIFTKN